VKEIKQTASPLETLKILFCGKTAGCYYEKNMTSIKITCQQNITLGGTCAGDVYLGS